MFVMLPAPFDVTWRLIKNSLTSAWYSDEQHIICCYSGDGRNIFVLTGTELGNFNCFSRIQIKAYHKVLLNYN